MDLSSIITYNVHLQGLLYMQWGMSAVGWSFDLLGLSAMCCTYTPHTQTHTYLAQHICNHELYTMYQKKKTHDACQPWPKHVCETPTWLVLPIDDTTNSTCPKPRRAKPSRQTSSNQQVQDTVKFRPDAEMHNNLHLQLANAILMFVLQSLFLAKTQTPSGSESKRLSRPQLVLATKFDRSASQVTPL